MVFLCDPHVITRTRADAELWTANVAEGAREITRGGKLVTQMLMFCSWQEDKRHEDKAAALQLNLSLLHWVYSPG